MTATLQESGAREALAREVIGVSAADETEAIVELHDRGLTRFTHNAVHQNLVETDAVVRVRAVVDGRVGVASTNDLAGAGLRACVARAIDLARFAPRDAAFPGLVAGATVTTPAGAYAASTAAATPQTRAEMTRAVFDVAERDRLWSAGYVTTTAHRLTIANTLGTLNSFDGTDAAINVKQNAADASGYGEQYVVDLTTLDATAVAERAARKAREGRAPVAVEPGELTVVLEPPALGELLAYLAEHFSARAYDEGSSFLTTALGKPCVGENVTLLDDYGHPLAVGMPFDYEGVPTKRLALVRDGIAENLVTDAYWAAKLDRENTGHGLPAPNAWGPQPRNLVLLGGNESRAELIAGVEHGLLITRFWYIRTVDQRQTIVTGMTRDGSFLIEHGKLTTGVHNLRFNQSILAALGRAQFSRELARTAGYSYSMVVPTARIDRFAFTSTTTY